MFLEYVFRMDGWVAGCVMGKVELILFYKLHLCATLREIQGWYACSLQENE